MEAEALHYSDGSDTFHGYLVRHEGEARPGILLAPTWAGLGDFEKDKAHEVAQLGYNVLALDPYGGGRRGGSVDENRALMKPLVDDRPLLRRRMKAGLDALKDRDAVQADRTAALGFCFGGLCVLDLARSGAEVQGIVSMHGLFTPPPDNLPNETIRAKVLLLHGYRDPMAPPQQLMAVASELDAAGVDWQAHAYGQSYHAFTNPKADNVEAGTVYNQQTAQRSWRLMVDFFREVL